MKNYNWWKPNNFFDKVYFIGDNSIEGFDNDYRSLDERTSCEVNGIINLSKPLKNAIILDAPCGYGRHSLELARRGYYTYGADINPRFIEIAKKNAFEQGLENVDFVCANISNLSLRKKFDLVLNLFFSVGFYRTERQNFKFLKSLINHLEKNGVFVLQTHIFKERFDHNNIVLNEDRILKNGSILRINKVLNKNREEGTWAIIKNNKIVEQCFYSMRVYSLEELELLLFKLGLKVISIYGGWDGNSFIKNESHNLIILAKKVDDD